MSDLENREQFLLKEYEAAAQLTYHIDDLRSRLTSFFLTLGGVAAAGLTLLLKGETVSSGFAFPEGVIAVLLLVVAVIGAIVVGILGRLRKVQLEHFRIVNNVRTYFLDTHYDLWNIVQLSAQTLPTPNRQSGSYLWVLLIMVVSAYFLGFALYLFLFKVSGLLAAEAAYTLAGGGSLLALFVYDRLYFRVASPPDPQTYSKEHPPMDPP